MSSYRHDIEKSFRKYYGALCYFASRYISESDKAVEDLVQDCFVKLIEKKVAFESEEYLRNYLYAAVRNSCLNHIQHDRVRERHTDYVLGNGFSGADAAESDYAGEVFSTEVVRCLLQKIEELPAQCRQVIRLSYVEGFDNETVAGKLGLSINTVRAHKMRGKKLLRLSLGKVAL